MNLSIFKAYDIRGKYPGEINEKVVSEITTALARYFKKGAIVIGRDARLSSPSLYRAVIKVLSDINKSRMHANDANKFSRHSHGLALSSRRVIAIGLTTTPMFYFLVNYFKAVGGIMITASHNPPEFNGLKVVEEKAVPMSGEDIRKLL